MQLPSVLLHEHLDGGLRVSTVLDLAARHGLDLPADDEPSLSSWFDQGKSGSLERYLDAFRYTVGVMQTTDALRRVAREAVEDLSDQGVVYAEIRFAPLLNTDGGLAPEAVVEAVIGGFEQASDATGMRWGLILDAMRDRPGSERVARLCRKYANAGVMAFDLAGPERGFPPDDHLPAIRMIRDAGLKLTIHAGEAAGVDSIRRAVQLCGTDRIGHGIEIVEDCGVVGGEIASLGPVASEVRERDIPLEICPMSNLHTKRWNPRDHPVGALYRAGFNVTINTDNRLMSSTSMPREFALLDEFHGWAPTDYARVTRAALAAAFCADDVKPQLWENLIAPRYSAAGITVNPLW